MECDSRYTDLQTLGNFVSRMSLYHELQHLTLPDSKLSCHDRRNTCRNVVPPCFKRLYFYGKYLIRTNQEGHRQATERVYVVQDGGCHPAWQALGCRLQGGLTREARKGHACDLAPRNVTSDQGDVRSPVKETAPTENF